MNIKITNFLVASLFIGALSIYGYSQSVSDEIRLSTKAKDALAKIKSSEGYNLPSGKSFQAIDTQELFSLPAPPTCSAIPSVSAATLFTANSYLLDQDVAAKLQISWIASGNAAADAASKVFIREFSKYALCRTTDGAGQLMYGGRFLVTVLINQTDASAGLNFAVAAASATLKSRTVQVRIDHRGFSDPQLPIKANAAQNITVAGLNVDSYGEFIKALNDAFSLAATSPLTMDYLGYLPDSTESEIGADIASVWALDRISQGFGCSDAASSFIKEFPSLNSPQNLSKINAVYTKLVIDDPLHCNAGNASVKLSALTLLNSHRLIRK